jgi:hypothetical protein
MKGEMILQCPFCAEKDAEIERLKFLNQEEQATIDELSKLITELADALEEESFQAADHPLVQRAREASK